MNWLTWLVALVVGMALVRLGYSQGHRHGRSEGALLACKDTQDFLSRNCTPNWMVGAMLGRFADEADAETRKKWAEKWIEAHQEKATP